MMTTDESKRGKSSVAGSRWREAMAACVNHSRSLLVSARAVQGVGHHNIAYHLAALALEEIGKRALLGLRDMAEYHKIPQPWMEKQSFDHVHKLWWCFFGGQFTHQLITKDSLDSMKSYASHIHGKRMKGLYVDQTDDGLSLPADAIAQEESERLIALAEARLAMVESEGPQQELTPEDVALQTWFLSISEDPERKRRIFTGPYLEKLAELKSANEWLLWVKNEFDSEDQRARELLQAELIKSRTQSGQVVKDKWRLRIRILSDSHTLRGKVLSDWNSKVEWIKLEQVSDKKTQLFVDFLLPSTTPMEALWLFGWGLSRQFVLALNIATFGLWWWRLPEQVSRYYERITDLENKTQLKVERTPQLKLDWGPRRVLDAADLHRLNQVFLALPGPDEQDKAVAYGHYMGGLTFLSLNDIHWQCEGNALANFFLCLRTLLMESAELKAGEPIDGAVTEALSGIAKEPNDLERLLTICRAVHGETPLEKLQINLTEVVAMKTACDIYILNKVVPVRLKEKLPKSGGNSRKSAIG